MEAFVEVVKFFINRWVFWIPFGVVLILMVFLLITQWYYIVSFSN